MTDSPPKQVSAELGYLIEMSVSVYDLRPVVTRAGRDKKIYGRKSMTTDPSKARQVAGGIPNCIPNLQLGKRALHFAQHFLFVTTPRASPQFKPHRSAPCRIA